MNQYLNLITKMLSVIPPFRFDSGFAVKFNKLSDRRDKDNVVISARVTG